MDKITNDLSTITINNSPNIGLIYDEIMTKHECRAGRHPECPQRIREIYINLPNYKYKRISIREATISELSLIHTKEHIDKMASITNSNKNQLKSMENKYN